MTAASGVVLAQRRRRGSSRRLMPAQSEVSSANCCGARGFTPRSLRTGEQSRRSTAPPGWPLRSQGESRRTPRIGASPSKRSGSRSSNARRGSRKGSSTFNEKRTRFSGSRCRESRTTSTTTLRTRQAARAGGPVDAGMPRCRFEPGDRVSAASTAQAYGEGAAAFPSADSRCEARGDSRRARLGALHRPTSAGGLRFAP